MTREEIIKIFEENHIAEGNATINATKLAEIFTKHEADLLKEFVEWQAKQYKELYHLYEEEIKEEKDHDDYIWLVGRKAGIGVIRQSLKTAVEKFLEDAKE